MGFAGTHIGAGIYFGSAAPRGRTQRSPLSGADVSPETHLGFAHKLHMRLWSKYSLVPLNQLLAWNSALRVWDLPNGQSMIQRYDDDADLGSAMNGKAQDYIDEWLTFITDPVCD